MYKSKSLDILSDFWKSRIWSFFANLRLVHRHEDRVTS